jgi:hypothetical protein
MCFLVNVYLLSGRPNLALQSYSDLRGLQATLWARRGFIFSCATVSALLPWQPFISAIAGCRFDLIHAAQVRSLAGIIKSLPAIVSEAFMNFELFCYERCTRIL